MLNLLKVVFLKIKKEGLVFQYFKYLIIGIISNIYSFIIFIIISFLGFPINISSSLGMLVGILNTYILSRIYLKKVIVPHSNKRLFFFSIYYAIAILITSQAIEILGSYKFLSYNLAWLYCNIIASILNFVFLNFITLATKQ